jgi:uncharacterized iron-regulated protein
MKRLLIALLFFAPLPAAALEHIIDVRSGDEISVTELAARLRGSDYVLLGELHDNPHHHRRRAELIARLAPTGVVVIAEHLDSGRRLIPDSSKNLQLHMEEAGFDTRAWKWPIHEPLFSGLLGAGLPVTGGNISKDLARRIVREGDSALPHTLRAIINRAPLNPVAASILDADLLTSHCGQLEPARIPPMRLAQRARDASMAESLLAANIRPAVLVAGNGHVRTDYGVPQLLSVLKPDARIVSIAFVENDSSASATPHDYVWQTEATNRDDPCTGFDKNR